MLITRQFLNFEAFMNGDFTDLRINCSPNLDGTIQHFYVHRVIMAAASTYFRDALMSANPAEKIYPDVVDVPISGSQFENYLKLIYEGLAVVDETEAEEFQYILQNVLGLTCLENKNEKKRKCDSSTEGKAKKPKIKREPGIKPDPDAPQEEEEEEEENQEESKPSLGLPSLILTDDLIKKMIKKTENGQFKCGICSKDFVVPRTAKDHILRLHVGGDDLPCNYCNLKFKSKQYLAKHIFQNHREVHKMHKLLNHK